MKRLLLVLCLFALSACQSVQNGVAWVNTPAEPSPTLFQVNGKIYSVQDFRQQLEQSIGPALAQMLTDGQTQEQIEQLANEQNVRQEIFNQMLQDALFAHIARAEGIGVDPASIDAAAFSQLPGFNPADPFAEQAGLRADLVTNQLSLEVIAKHTWANMFHIRQILVADEATATTVLHELEAGAPFAELVARYSQDAASAQNGGDLGWIPTTDYVPEVEEAAFTQPLGTPLIVQSSLGFHVIEILDRAFGDSLEEKRTFDSFAQLQGSQNGQQFYTETFLPWYERYLEAAKQDGTVVVSDIDLSTIPLPFPES